MMMNQKIILILSYTVLICFPMKVSIASEYEKSISHEEVAFMFSDINKRDTDYRRVIKGTSKYKNSRAIEKSFFLENMIDEMKLKRQDFILEKNYFAIHTYVGVTLDINHREEMSNLIINLPDTDLIYYPYIFGNEIISIVPRGLDLFKITPVKKYDLYYMMDKINLGDKNLFEIIFKPVDSDYDTTVSLDGHDHYIILSDIAKINLYGIDDVLLWSYSSPWYKKENILGDILMNDLR